MAQSLHCAYCAKQFSAKRASAVYCSDSCRVRASRDRNYLCFYCGFRANARDHVIPHAISGDKVRKWSGVDLVESCAECNSLLGANLFRTMESRIAFLAGKFAKRHRLSSPHIEWAEDELLELSGSLRNYVRGKEAEYWERWRRWQHMLTRAAQMELIEND